MGQIMKICLKDHVSFLQIKPYLELICVGQRRKSQRGDPCMKQIFFSKEFSDFNHGLLDKFSIFDPNIHPPSAKKDLRTFQFNTLCYHNWKGWKLTLPFSFVCLTAEL